MTSIPSYKNNHPLVLNKENVKLSDGDNGITVELALFSKAFKDSCGLKKNVKFLIQPHDNTQRSILARLLSGAYQLGQCQLIYEKKKFFLLLTYLFPPVQTNLDPEKILGVDLGETYAIYASAKGQHGSLKIEGGEITAYAGKLEKRRRSLQNQAMHCGDGRIGHGVKTRVANVYQARNRIANFRDTINHRYSKALIDYAVKNGYGTIQLEDLSQIKERTKFPKRLQHWTYYDLQSKIEAKAKEYGIRVVKINPQYTSQRCSQCGCIDSRNRPTQSQFQCINCNFSCNADWNASQNISIKEIEQIIADTLVRT